MPNPTVIILERGVVGVVPASEVRRRLERKHRAVLVDREAAHVPRPSLLWVQVRLRNPGKISRDLSLLKKKNIEVMHGEMQSIDPDSKRVRVPEQELNGNFLVVFPGTQLAPEQIPGLAEAGHNLHPLDGSSKIRDTTAGQRRLAVKIQ